MLFLIQTAAVGLTCRKVEVAEWSKAVDSGSIPKGRGFKSHLQHFLFYLIIFRNATTEPRDQPLKRSKATPRLAIIKECAPGCAGCVWWPLHSAGDRLIIPVGHYQYLHNELLQNSVR